MIKHIRAGLLAAWIACAAMPLNADQAPLVEALQAPADISFCGEAVPLEVDHVQERFEKEMLLTLWDRPQVVLWLKRAPRFFPFIEASLKKRGMPDDLKYIAVAESALRPHAGSVKGAIGFWQMLPETARRYGLRVDEYVDQRRNLFLSTPAALTHLQGLYDQFSSWSLAAAAYNMGEEGLEAEILEQNTKDYYKLYLSLETQRYLFRILAVKLILQDPVKYGFNLTEQMLYKPYRFEEMNLDCFEQTPISLVAEAAGTYFKNIKDLNPHLRGHYIQEGRHRIYLPKEGSAEFKKQLDRLMADYSRKRKQHIYIVQSGDSLSAIADRFDVPLAALMIWNRIDLNRTIHPGDRLVIYPRLLKEIEP